MFSQWYTYISIHIVIVVMHFPFRHGNDWRGDPLVGLDYMTVDRNGHHRVQLKRIKHQCVFSKPHLRGLLVWFGLAQ